MLTVSYLGYSEEMVKCITVCEQYELLYVVGTKGRMSENYYETVRNNSLNYLEIQDKKDLLRHVNVFGAVDLIIMYKFEFIIPQEIIDTHRVFNFHGGNLMTNRGAHAVVWSVLLREKNTCLSCYELTGGIDEGLLIAQYGVEVGKDDDTMIVNEKLIKGIPWLLKELHEYMQGIKEATIVKGGVYRRKIDRSDFTIDIKNDTIDGIRGKVLSQAAFDGAILDIAGKETRISRYKYDRLEKNTKDRVISNSKDYIKISDGVESITLYFNGTKNPYMGGVQCKED